MANFNQPWNQNNTFAPPYNGYNQFVQYPNTGGGVMSSSTQPINTIQQVPLTPTGLSGKTVNSPQEILPQDVPMNGFTSYFPKADGSEIYAKCWNSNGTIDTRVYILKPLDELKPEEPDIMSQILLRLESIEHKVSYKPRYNSPKKEDKNNG